MAGVSDLGGLTNSGSMPISAGGGAAGDATAGGNSSFSVGSLYMGNSGQTSRSGLNTLVLVGLVLIGGYLLLKRK